MSLHSHLRQRYGSSTQKLVRDYEKYISVLRWPRKAMSITDFNFFHFQFGNFSLPISNLQIYHYQFHFFVLPISNLHISCYQIENFSLPNWIFLVSNLDISHNLPIIHTRTHALKMTWTSNKSGAHARDIRLYGTLLRDALRFLGNQQGVTHY